MSVILAEGAVERELPAVSVILAEGAVFARRYRVVRLIAAGAMGAVHEVVHLETERRRALKVMHAHLFQSEDMRERFKQEARIAAKVESEHIVDVSDAGVDEATGMPFLVMELLRGEDLGERLERAGRLPPAEAVTYLYQTALALERTHAASIVHRDLKPANIFLSKRENGSVRVKILDFGIAKLVAESTTAAGATSNLGTPMYMPPEQFHGGTRLTAATDIFALGMIAYELLVGTAYWDPEVSSADGVFAFAMVAMRGPQELPVQRARSQGVELPPGFDAWFAQVTAVDPAARLRGAMEAVQSLGEVVGVRVGGNRRSSPSAPFWPGTVPATTAMAGALLTQEPAPALSSDPEHDARSSDPTSAQTSTGAPVYGMPSRLAKPSRGPLTAGLAALGLIVLLGAGGWLTLRAGRGGMPAAAPDVAVASTAAPETTPAAPKPTATAPEVTAAVPPSSAVAPAPPPSATAPSAVAPRASSPVGVPVSKAPASTALRSGGPPPAATIKPAPTGAKPPSAGTKPPPPQRLPASLFGRP